MISGQNWIGYTSYKKPTQLSLEFADEEPDTGKGL